MDLLFWGLTAGIAGEVLIGVAVMSVHWRIVKEHKIDRVVLREMRRERNLALICIALMVLGYILKVSHFGYLPEYFFPL